MDYFRQLEPGLAWLYLAAPAPVLPSSNRRFAGYMPATELNGRLVVAKT